MMTPPYSSIHREFENYNPSYIIMQDLFKTNAGTNYANAF